MHMVCSLCQGRDIRGPIIESWQQRAELGRTTIWQLTMAIDILLECLGCHAAKAMGQGGRICKPQAT